MGIVSFLVGMGIFFTGVCTGSPFVAIFGLVVASIGGLMPGFANLAHTMRGGNGDLPSFTRTQKGLESIAVWCFVAMVVLVPISMFGGAAIFPVLALWVLWKVGKGLVKAGGVAKLKSLVKPPVVRHVTIDMVQTPHTAAPKDDGVDHGAWYRDIMAEGEADNASKDATEALKSLGFSKADAEKAVANSEWGTSEDIIKGALSKSRRPLPD